MFEAPLTLVSGVASIALASAAHYEVRQHICGGPVEEELSEALVGLDFNSVDEAAAARGNLAFRNRNFLRTCA